MKRIFYILLLGFIAGSYAACTGANKEPEQIKLNTNVEDSDGDGVLDSNDICVNTPAGTVVDLHGCPVETLPPDASVTETETETTPLHEFHPSYGHVMSPMPITPPSGPDTDADGVGDSADLCPETPAGMEVGANGCPVYWGIKQLGGDYADRANKVASDPSGNVHVVGRAARSRSDTDYYPNWLTFSQSGVLLTDREYEDTALPSQFNDIAADRDGNIYLLMDIHGGPGDRGHTYLLKYLVTGTKTQVEITESSSKEYRARALAIDDDNGFVYVVGYSNEAGGYVFENVDAFVTKYRLSNLERNPFWYYRDSNPDVDEYANSVALDNDGNIYIAGYLSFPSGGDSDYFLVKYEKSGRLLYQDRQRIRSTNERANGVAVFGRPDGKVNVYVAGRTNGYLGTESGGTNHGDMDIFVAQYKTNSSDSSRLEKGWVKQLGNDKGDDCSAVDVDEVGDVYGAGYLRPASGTSTRTYPDAYVFRLAGDDSRLIWDKTFVSDEDDYATSLAFDKFWNLYVAGHTNGTLVAGHAGSGGFDIFLIKLNRKNGDVL